MTPVVVISDTGPIHYLILIGRVDLLSHFFGEVLVPSAVLRELNHPHTPLPVREWILNRPPWIKEVVCPKTAPRFDGFGLGEREALTVAALNPGSVLLCDDGAARSAAKSEQIAVSGTLGVLRDAALSNLLEIRQEVDKLRNPTNFRGSEQLLDSLCEETERLIRERSQLPP
jgi:predicted nucleic acid-binding protein